MILHFPPMVSWVICTFLYQYVKFCPQKWLFNSNLFIYIIYTFSLRIIIKDILYYIKKSGLINSKYVSWNSYVLQNDQFFFLESNLQTRFPKS